MCTYRPPVQRAVEDVCTIAPSSGYGGAGRTATARCPPASSCARTEVVGLRNDDQTGGERAGPRVCAVCTCPLAASARRRQSRHAVDARDPVDARAPAPEHGAHAILDGDAAPSTGRAVSSAVTHTSELALPHLKCTERVVTSAAVALHRLLLARRASPRRALSSSTVEAGVPSGSPITSTPRRREAWQRWAVRPRSLGPNTEASRWGGDGRSHGTISPVSGGIGADALMRRRTRRGQNARARHARDGRAQLRLEPPHGDRQHRIRALTIPKRAWNFASGGNARS